MRVLDLFAGTGSATQAFKDRGHEVVTVDNDPSLHPDIVRDLSEPWWAPGRDYREIYRELFPGRWDFLWASPPCQAFSVAAIGRNWRLAPDGSPRPKTKEAEAALYLTLKTLTLIEVLAPTAWVMENPRGMMRKAIAFRGKPRYEICYCRYGDTRMKPTDLFGYPPATWMPRPMCKNGNPDHEAAPRGAKTGTQGLANAKERGRVPYELSLELCLAMEALL